MAGEWVSMGDDAARGLCTLLPTSYETKCYRPNMSAEMKATKRLHSYATSLIFSQYDDAKIGECCAS